MPRRPCLIACLLAAGTTTSLAHAESPRTMTDWERALVEGRAWALAKSGDDRTVLPDAAPRESGPITPRLTVVARDWAESHRLFGPELSLTDVQRVSRSTRAVVTRLSLVGGAFAPFVQVSIGQFRVDPSLLLSLPQRSETAAQVGAGFQLSLSHRWRIAAEGNFTQIYREGRSSDDLPLSGVASGVMASRLTFD